MITLTRFIKYCSLVFMLLALGISIAIASKKNRDCDPDPTDMTIAYGELMDGPYCTIAHSGQVDLFRFNGSAGDPVVLILADGDGDYWRNPCVEVRSAANQVVVPNGCTQNKRSVEFSLPASGSYLVLVREDNNDTVGAYGLSLDRIPSVNSSTPLPCYACEVSTNVAYLDVNFYLFSATAGDQLLINLSDHDGDYWLNPCMSLRKPDGTKMGDDICTQGIATLEKTITETGTYTIRVWEDSLDSVGFGLYVRCLFGPCLGAQPFVALAGLTSTGQIYYTKNLNTWANPPGQLARLYVGDLNSDKQPDLAGLASNGSIWYSTDRNIWTQAPGGLSQMGVGDFNGDGKDDLVGLASDGSVWYSTDLGAWTRVPGGLSQIVTGDFNGDGQADLAGLASNGTVWYSTDLATWTQAPGALAQLRVGDLNGDGKDDLAGIAANGSVWYSTTLNGWTQAPGQLAQLQVGDINGDGKDDLAGVASNGSVWYSTTLTGWTQLPGALSQLVVSDLNYDGKADLAGITANGTIWYSIDLTGWNNLPGQLAQLVGR